MATITDALSTSFREQGFVVIPELLSSAQIAAGREIIASLLEKQPYAEGYVGAHFLWPRFDGDRQLLEFYRETGIADLGGELLRSDLRVEEPDFAQVALTIPPWPHRPGGPHVDGLTPGLADGTPGTFTMLAGIWLTDHEQLDRGNLYVWPGTHLRFGTYLAEHGADALSRVEEMNPGPYPKIELGESVQVSGPAGSVLFAHYLLAHNLGGHWGSADDERRETIYYRLHATAHRTHWRDAVTAPLTEFRSPN